MSHDDTNYYRQRAVVERAMALASERHDVREIHEELARQYQALVEQAELRPTVRISVADRDAVVD
jgi:hypothetical protein